MKQFWMFTGAILLILLIIFLVAEQLELTSLFTIQGWMYTPSLGVMLIGVAILAGDVLLPVPSSLVMIAHGAIFSFWLGTLVSLIGQTGSVLLGYSIGRMNSSLTARFVSPEHMTRTNHFLRRWGLLAIIITRPIPLVAETTTIIAGTVKLDLTQVLIASLAGGLPTAALYALAGTVAVSFNSTFWSFLLVMLVAGVFWLLREPLDRVLSSTVGKPPHSGKDNA